MNPRTRLASLLLVVAMAIGVAVACAPRAVTMQVTPPLGPEAEASADPIAEASDDAPMDASEDPPAEAAAMPPQDSTAAPAAAPTSTPAPQSRSVNAAPGPLRPTVPGTFFVGNTLGRGMTIRQGPASVELIKAWPEGTLLVGLGSERDAFGWTWAQVRDPDGNIGWMPTTYLTRSAPTAPDSEGPSSAS